MANIIIYTSTHCPYCVKAKQLLAYKGTSFEEINVDGKPELRTKMKKLAEKNTVPQIWINEKHIGGCDDLFALESSGELDTLLATNN